MLNESKILIDMSGVNQICDNMLGFFIDIFFHYRKNGIMIKIIPPKAEFMKTYFREIGAA